MYENGPKWGEPRPAGLGPLASLPLQHFIVQLCGTWLEHKIKFTPMWFKQNSQVKTESLEPSEVEPKSNDNPKIQNSTQLEEHCGPCEQCARATEARAEPEPGRPAGL